MKNEKMYDGITNIRDDLVTAAAEHKFTFRKKRLKRRWISAVAAVLVVAIIGGIMMGRGPLSTNAYAIYEAEYPEMAPYPTGDTYSDIAHNAWWEDIRRQKDQPDGYEDGIDEFIIKTVPYYLDTTGGRNAAYSPLSVYMTLAMLAEMTEGNSRSQVLELLGHSDIESVRKQAASVWNANYRNDGAVTRILETSVWLRDDITYNETTMKRLAENYFASSFAGDVESEAYAAALRAWLSENTGGLLDKQLANEEFFNKNTAAVLASTIYFNAKWVFEFREGNNETALFHSPNGDVEREFMNQSFDGTYFWGERFSAVTKDFEAGGMTFILPDEGVNAEELLTDEEVLKYMMAGYGWENKQRVIVNFSVPKFDVESKTDLTEGLKELGVTDVFDWQKSDFSPTTTETPIEISKATHGVRVKIDEEGCEAASYTVMVADGGAAPPSNEEVDFVLDRPFVFVVTGEKNLPLFIGVVNNP